MKQLKNVQHDFDVEVGSVAVTLRNGFKWATAPRASGIERRALSKAWGPSRGSGSGR